MLSKAKRYVSIVALTGVTMAAAAAGVSLAHDGEAPDDAHTLPPLGDSGLIVMTPGETVPVAGPDGEPIVCDDGQTLRVDPISDNPPRAMIESEPIERGVAEITQGAVPRCGPSGGGNEGDPVWVPDDVGAEYPQEAPKRYARAQAK